MEHKKRIAILDENEAFRMALERELSARGYLIRISTSNSDDVLEIIRRQEADVLITDVLLFGTDGADFIKRAVTARTGGYPKILVCSIVKEPSIIRELICCGVSDYVHKQSPISVVASHVDMLCPAPTESYEKASSETPQRLEKTVTTLLLSLGIPIKLKGFHYIRYGVIQALLSNEPSAGISKSVYPDLIKKYGATQKSAERAIRTAIEHIWRSGKKDLLKKTFAYTGEKRPSNAVFIALITDKLRLYDEDCHAVFKEEFQKKTS